METSRITELSERPAFTLTGGEMADLIISRMKQYGVTKIQDQPQKRIRIDGIVGLADFIKCSITTAQKLKNQGKFPFYNIGSKVYFYSDEVEKGMRSVNNNSL